jgi:glutamate-1-semialdehyde 2,1-aminomutase
MESLAGRLASGLQLAVTTYGVPWHVVRVGARVEFICAPGPLRNGTQAEAAHAPALEQAIHLALLNRGCLIAPFHNMMLVSPATTAEQVEILIQAFESVVASLALDFATWQ